MLLPVGMAIRDDELARVCGGGFYTFKNPESSKHGPVGREVSAAQREKNNLLKLALEKARWLRHEIPEDRWVLVGERQKHYVLE